VDKGFHVETLVHVRDTTRLHGLDVARVHRFLEPETVYEGREPIGDHLLPTHHELLGLVAPGPSGRIVGLTVVTRELLIADAEIGRQVSEKRLLELTADAAWGTHGHHV